MRTFLTALLFSVMIQSLPCVEAKDKDTVSLPRWQVSRLLVTGPIMDADILVSTFRGTLISREMERQVGSIISNHLDKAKLASEQWGFVIGHEEKAMLARISLFAKENQNYQIDSAILPGAELEKKGGQAPIDTSPQPLTGDSGQPPPK